MKTYKVPINPLPYQDKNPLDFKVDIQLPARYYGLTSQYIQGIEYKKTDVLMVRMWQSKYTVSISAEGHLSPFHRRTGHNPPFPALAAS